jgi:RNA polymerase sigma-70 factor, ECF subfamily
MICELAPAGFAEVLVLHVLKKPAQRGAVRRKRIIHKPWKHTDRHQPEAQSGECQIEEKKVRTGCMATERKAAITRQEPVFSQTVVDSSEQDEDKLIKDSQQGDQDAFAILVQRHQRRVFNLSLRLVQDYDEASEITQEAFLSAWQGLPAFRGEARFSTWLYRITYHCGIRQLEKRKREMALQEAMQEEQRIQVYTQEKNLEDIVERHEQRALLRLSLEQLPARYRLILILRDFQEMTYQEMANKLALPIGTIKTHLFRARHLLKQRLLALALENQA